MDVNFKKLMKLAQRVFFFNLFLPFLFSCYFKKGENFEGMIVM